jgi:aspartyl-tRNA(Asn)/glutamyl-tRNA(Gln) amidotransferase subunit A
MRDDLTALGIAETAALFRSRRISPRELVAAHLERAALDPDINAIATLTEQRAHADAERAERELASGQDRGPLQGIPITLKDNIDVSGVRTTAGSRLYADRVPSVDSTVAARLREAGAVLIGKANMHELALGVETDNALFGRTRNPWDTAHIPGGSSGGSTAAVAAGIGLASIGTDSGGSIRVPAALCGLVGLKPTYGRVSNAGIIPNYPSFDCAGPIARSAKDVAFVLSAIAGYDPDDFGCARTPVDDYAGLLSSATKDIRVGVPRRQFYAGASEPVRSAFDTALDVYRSLGAIVRDIEIPDLDIPSLKAAARPELGQRYADAIRTRPGDIGDEVRAKLIAALETDLEGHLRARRASEALAAGLRRILEEVDVLAMPAVPVTAPLIGTKTIPFEGRDADVEDVLIAHARIFNLARLPALTHPCGFDSASLPIGLQLVGRPFDEALLIRAAHAFSTATEWHRRRPGVDPGGREWMHATH